MLFYQASWSRVWLIWAWKMHDSWPLPSPENQCTEFWWPRQLRLDNETPLRAIYNLKAHPDQVATMQWCMMGTVIAIDEYSKAGCPSPSPWRRPPGWSVTLSLLECVALDEDGGRRRMERWERKIKPHQFPNGSVLSTLSTAAASGRQNNFLCDFHCSESWPDTIYGQEVEGHTFTNGNIWPQILISNSGCNSGRQKEPVSTRG